MIQIIKAETLKNLGQIESIACEIWTEHYEPIIGSRQVEYMLSQFQSVAAMSAQIQEGYEYYMVFYYDELAGYFSYIRQAKKLFLSKYYMHKKYRGKGLGSRSMDFILSFAREENLFEIELTVNRNNLGAISVYEKMGFQTMDNVVKDIGQGFVMDDYVMKLKV